MVIKITWKTLAVAAAGALVVYAAYKTAKKENEKEEKLKEHKEETLKDRELVTEMRKVSTENENFTPEQRADAHKVLRFQYWKLDKARTIEDFDDALDILDCMIKQIGDKDKDKALTYLLVWNQRFKENEEKLRLQRDDQRERDRLKVERDKADKISNAIKTAVKTINNPSTYNIEKLIDKAQEVIVYHEKN